MFHSLLPLLAQLEGDTSGVAEKAADVGKEAGGRSPGLIDFLLPMMLVMIVMMLFMRPKKGDKQSRQGLADLKKNDRVVTAGGIVGTVVSTGKENDIVTVRIDESTNARMQVLKSSIIKVLPDEKADEKK